LVSFDSGEELFELLPLDLLPELLTCVDPDEPERSPDLFTVVEFVAGVLFSVRFVFTVDLRSVLAGA
jgi:hypothetical protein